MITKEKIYFDSIDTLRGIAALMVCFFHLSKQFLPESHWFCWLFQEGHLGVEIFFVITGFVIPYSLYAKNYELTDLPKFIAARFARLLPLYWFSVFCIILVLLSPNVLPQPIGYQTTINWHDAFWHLFLLNPYLGRPWFIVIYWSLAVEFQFYFFVALAYFGFTHIYMYARWAMVLLFGLSAFWLNNNFFTFYAYLFLPGILFFLLKIKKIKQLEFWLLLIFDCAALYYQRGEWTRPLIIFLTIVTMHFNQFRFRYSKQLGDWSYCIYLFHLPIAYFILPNVQKILGLDELNLIFILATTLIIILFSMVLHHILEKKLINISKNIFSKSHKS